MTTITNLPVIAQTRALAPKSTTTLPSVINTAAKSGGGYGKLAAALIGLGVLGAATYLACKKSGGEEKAE